MLENDELDEKQLLIEHLTLLYNHNVSLYLQSTRTIEDGGLDSNPNNFDKSFYYGDLNCNEFNNSSNKNIKKYTGLNMQCINFTIKELKAVGLIRI